MEDRSKFVKDAADYIEDSQKVKAARDLLAEKRDGLIPLFKKFIKPDENGNRELEFDDNKISLVPQRRINEEALKTKLGPDAARFTEHGLGISLHLVRVNHGSDMVKRVEEAIKEAIRTTLKMERVPPKVVVEVTHFDAEAALASLPKEEQVEVKETVTFTLRPYPEKKGLDKARREAESFLS